MLGRWWSFYSTFEKQKLRLHWGINRVSEQASDSGRYSGVVMDYAAPFFAIGSWIENLIA